MRLFVMLVVLVLGSWQLGFSETINKETFGPDGELWTATFTPLDNFDSDLANASFEIRSDSNAAAVARPAWVGDDPGDLGPIWVIQNQGEEALGACWSLHEREDIQCHSLYVPSSFSFD